MENLVTASRLQAWYNNKRVFITGHTGFKGSWLIALLHVAGAKIKGYALPPDNDKGLFRIIEPLNLCQTVFADIRDRERLEKELIAFQPDFIFHLAAQPLVRRSYEIPAETFDINVTGTANLLQAIDRLQHRCTTVVVTTDKVYENREDQRLYNETDRLGGNDPYSASKACAEMVAHSFYHSFFNKSSFSQQEKKIATARAGNVIGGGDWNTDRIVPDIIRALEMQTPVRIRNPEAIRPWQHVLESLTGYLLLGATLQDNSKPLSKAFNFGPLPDDHLPVRQLVEIAIEKWGIGSWQPVVNYNAPHEAGILKLDICLAEKELGWKPRLNAHEAIAWTVAWYRQPIEQKANYTFDQIKKFLAL
ncbi:MAG TPA: CDP-glucose 4,6-dehydratase [Flavitalea sp.]|nr:CDP-glucose 4,6-dehydratase [Flavitalea sp.]